MNIRCNGCGKTDAEEFFPSAPYRCKACHRQDSREWKRAHVPRGERFLVKKDGNRICTRCKTAKPSTPDFFLVMKGVPTSPCRECWNAERRATYVSKVRKPAKGRDPIKRAASKKARKARERGATVSDFTAEQWAYLKAAFAQKCAYCHEKKPLTQDHVIPLSRGGAHTASNIVPACRSCNSRKNNRTAPDFQPVLMLV